MKVNYAFFGSMYRTLSNILTTKGDLLGFSTTEARLGVGADNEILTADSAQALGIKWAAPADVTFARIVKKIDEIKTSDDTIAADSEMVIALQSGKTYFFQCYIFFNTEATPDFKYNFTGPTNSQNKKLDNGNWSAIAEVQTQPITDVEVISVTSTTNEVLMTLGSITTTAAGNLSLQWAQNVSSVNPTTVEAGSFLVVWEETP